MSEENKAVEPVEIMDDGRVYITGTDGGKDYMVVGYKDGLVLGVRPLIEGDGTGPFIGIGMRVRLCNPDGTAVEERINIDEFLEGSALGVFSWSKVNDVRASAMVMSTLPTPPSNLSVEDVMGYLQKGDLIEKLVSYIFANFTLDNMCSPEDLAKWIVEVYTKRFTEIIGVKTPEDLKPWGDVVGDASIN